MNAKHIAIAALIAATGSTAFAAEGSEGPTGVSTKTRAEVIAEVAAARAQGTLFVGGEGQQVVFAVPSSRDRADVRAEARTVRTSIAHLYQGA